MKVRRQLLLDKLTTFFNFNKIKQNPLRHQTRIYRILSILSLDKCIGKYKEKKRSNIYGQDHIRSIHYNITQKTFDYYIHNSKVC
jgi:hypothetical protein